MTGADYHQQQQCVTLSKATEVVTRAGSGRAAVASIVVLGIKPDLQQIAAEP